MYRRDRAEKSDAVQLLLKAATEDKMERDVKKQQASTLEE